MTALYLKLLNVGLVLLGIVAVFCVAAPLFWVFELATHFTVYWVLGCLLASGCFLFSRRWYRGAVGLLLGGWFAWGLVPYYLGNSAAVAPSLGANSQVTLVHFNLLWNNAEYPEVEAFLKACDADIVVLQEFTPRWETELQLFLSAYPHREVEARAGAFGMAVLSRFPIAEAQWHPDLQAKLPYLDAKLDVDGRPLHLVAVHAWSPSGKTKAQARNEMLRHVSELAAAGAGTPTVVVGDFNCTPWSPVFRELCRNGKLRDSALGRGITSTWSPIPPFGIPIDHVLVSEGIVVVKREVGPGDGFGPPTGAS